MNGDTTVLLSEILRSVGLTGDVTAVSVSNESLFSASDESGEWVVTAHQAFTGKEWMKVTIDGVAYEITVTDEQNAVASVTNGDTTTTYSSFDEAITAWTAGTTLTLLADVTTSGINVNQSKTLDLNGHTITLSSTQEQQRLIQVENNPPITFTLKDSSGTNAGKLTGVNSPSNDWSGTLWVGLGATVNMYGGTITGNTTSWGAGVWIDARNHSSTSRNGGTFNMYGGVITGNTATYGGGVCVKFKWSNNCTSGTGHFNMYGGTISGNTATHGGNVYIGEGEMTMTGGTIDGSFEDKDNRYVIVSFNANTGTGEMSNQYVKKNTATKIKKNGFTAPVGDDFNCWNTQADGNGTSYTESVNITADTTLYAQWKAIPATAPTINKQPGNLTPTYGYTDGSVSVTATAASGHTVSGYQWYSCDDTSKTNPQAISGATAASYTIPTGKSAGTTEYYYCVVTATRTDNNQTQTAESNVATVTVNKAAATVTADAKSKTYGENDPALTATVTGIVGTDTLNYTVSREGGEDVGEYEIAVTLGSNPNYDVTAINGKFTIAKKAATVTADAKSKTYGEDDPDLTATVNGVVGTETLNYTVSRAEGETAGEYAITVTLGSNPNYNVTANNGTFTIAMKAATIKADDKSKTYGENDPALTATVTGVVGTDTLNYTLSRAEGETVGEYAITVTLESNQNYDVTATNGTFTIVKKAATVTTAPTAKTLTYNNSAQELVNAGEAEGGTMQYALGTDATTPPENSAYTTSVPTGTDAETYYVWYKVVGDDNHSDTEGLGPVTVTIIDPTAENDNYAFVPDGTKDDEVATAKDPTYQWRKNSGDSLLFVIKSVSDDDQTFGKFKGVRVDGNEVNDKYFTAAQGSLRLTLKTEYLQTLSVGEHTLTVQFDDGTVTHKFMILPASAGSDSPGTGENGVTIALNCLLLVISAAGAAYAVFREKKSIA